MKSAYCQIVIFIILSNSVVAFNIDSSITIVNIPKSTTAKVSNIGSSNFSIEIKILGPKDTSKTTDVLLLIAIDDDEKFSGLEIFTKSIYISKYEFQNNLASSGISKEVYKTIVGTFNHDTAFVTNVNKILRIQVSTSTKNVQINNPLSTVKFVKSSFSQNHDGVSLAIGTNFDIADGLKVNSFYGRISVLEKELFKIKNEPKGFGKFIKTIGLFGGIYQNRYVTIKGRPEFSPYYKVNSIGNFDSVSVTRAYASKSQTIKSNNYGLLLSLPIYISTYSKPNHSVYFSITPIDFEIILRNTLNTFTFSYQDSSLVKKPISFLNDSIADNSTEQQFVDKFVGLVTLSYNMHGKDYNVFIKASPISLFWTNSINNNLEERSSNSNHRSKIIPAYSFYFGVTERKFGIRIGGEFKGSYGIRNPFFNLFITKSFDFARFGDAFKGGE